MAIRHLAKKHNGKLKIPVPGSFRKSMGAVLNGDIEITSVKSGYVLGLSFSTGGLHRMLIISNRKGGTKNSCK